MERTETEFRIRIGPLMKAMIEKQKKIISDATYDCVDSSDYEAGEIIAKKFSSSL